MVYQIAIGFNNAAGLFTVEPQPRSNGIFTMAQEIYAISGKVYEDGYLYTEWIYSMMTEEEYSDFNSDIGLDDEKSIEVTIRTVTNYNDRAFANFNGIIVRPKTLVYQYWWQNVVFRIHNLVAI